MKQGAMVAIGLFVTAATLGLLQLWFELFDWIVFTKIIITLAVLFVVVVGVALAYREYVNTKKLKDSGFID